MYFILTFLYLDSHVLCIHHQEFANANKTYLTTVFSYKSQKQYESYKLIQAHKYPQNKYSNIRTEIQPKVSENFNNIYENTYTE